MKKRLICLAVAILLLTTLCLPACAASSAHIVDLSELLSESEHSSLEAAAAQVEEQYGCGVYVVIVDDYSTYYDAGSIEEFAESAYAELELGVGTDRNCILLARQAGLYKDDKLCQKQQLTSSHDNPTVRRIYKDFSASPMDDKMYSLLHTHFSQRSLLALHH